MMCSRRWPNCAGAAFLSSPDMRQAVVRLGSAEAVIRYPAALGVWFSDLPEVAGPTSARRFTLQPAVGSKFSVSAGEDAPIPGLDLGDALATLWEQVAVHLVDDMDGAFALHAAALANPTGQVLLPGRSGAGKTRLALWYRTRASTWARTRL